MAEGVSKQDQGSSQGRGVVRVFTPFESALIAELRLWRSLVVEGGVPRYTVIPGAALNSVVTSTDGILAREGAAQ